VSTVYFVSEFWGGDGKTWVAVIAAIVLLLLPFYALYHARTFIKKL
jgi:hypothetical protein